MPYFLIAIANVLGGVSYLFQKLCLESMPPATTTLLRNVISVVAFLVVLRGRALSIRGWSRSELARLVFLGVVAYGLPMWLGIVGVRDSTSANASLLVLLEPVTILLLAAAFLGERISRRRLVGIGLGFAGALAIVLEGASLAGLTLDEHLQGNLILALHGVLWGFYTPVARTLAVRRDPFVLALWTQVFSLVFLVPAALLETEHWSEAALAPQPLLWVFLLGFVVTFGGTAAWLVALRGLSASIAAGFVFLQPLAGVLAGGLVLGERLSIAALFGGLLISLGLFLTLAPKRGTELEASG